MGWICLDASWHLSYLWFHLVLNNSAICLGWHCLTIIHGSHTDLTIRCALLRMHHCLFFLAALTALTAAANQCNDDCYETNRGYYDSKNVVIHQVLKQALLLFYVCFCTNWISSLSLLGSFCIWSWCSPISLTLIITFVFFWWWICCNHCLCVSSQWIVRNFVCLKQDSIL